MSAGDGKFNVIPSIDFCICSMLSNKPLYAFSASSSVSCLCGIFSVGTSKLIEGNAPLLLEVSF